MNKVPKCKPKFLIPHQNNIKISQKESFNEHLVPKITQRNLKFSGNRNFGKDISNSIKNNVKNINNNQSSKVDSANDKKSNNNIYIKKHSSASQVAQKTQKIKIAINDKKLRENKSGAIINKKNDISINKDNYKIMNTKKEKENIISMLLRMVLSCTARYHSGLIMKLVVLSRVILVQLESPARKVIDFEIVQLIK